MTPDQLHVFAARSNPVRWATPDKVFNEWAQHMLDSGVSLTVIELAYGERPFTCDLPHVNHIGVRGKTWCWSKENLLNIGIQRTPQAKYISWIDTDVFFRRPDWASDTIHALQNWDIIQPWRHAYDLGPNDEHMASHVSFCSQFHSGQPVAPTSANFWKHDNGPYEYPHSGYAWSATRQAIDWVGGLFEHGGMGSGDHHMALSLVGASDKSLPGGVSSSYRDAVKQWESRALNHINKNIGFIQGTIEHRFHGKKAQRGYTSRWDMFIKHGFDPFTDLKRNSQGVMEWAGNKPFLKQEFERYLMSRNEDCNSLN